jgi:hypothetical protein
MLEKIVSAGEWSGGDAAVAEAGVVMS